jgi:hypothetical protein
MNRDVSRVRLILLLLAGCAAALPSAEHVRPMTQVFKPSPSIEEEERELWSDAFYHAVKGALAGDTTLIHLGQIAQEKLAESEPKRPRPPDDGLSIDQGHRGLDWWSAAGAMSDGARDWARRAALATLSEEPANAVARLVLAASQDPGWDRWSRTGRFLAWFHIAWLLESGGPAMRVVPTPERFWDLIRESALRRASGNH